MIDERLVEGAIELTKAVNRAADENLPGELAGIVKLHSGLAVGAAFIPVPGADVAAAGANIWTMYVRINKAIGLPFQEHLLKSIATGLATNLIAYAGASIIVGSVVKLFPGIGTVAGIAISGATVYAVTMVSGYVYMKALAKVLNANVGKELQAEELSKAIKDVMSDRENIKALVKGAKESYKEEQVETEQEKEAVAA